MTLAPLLVTCLLAPLFPPDWTGATCSTARQAVECGCSECMTWEAASDAEWYEVLRTNPDAQTQDVGSTRERNPAEIAAFVTDDGILILPSASEIVRMWCFARDIPHPVQGALYRYQVRGCRAPRAGETGDACGPYTGTLQYRAAPYACFHVGSEIACYTGDPVVTP